MLLRLALAVCAATAVVALPFQLADAQDAAVEVQRSAARAYGAPHRKAAAIERLCRMDSASARAAVAALADDTDDRTAVTAITALCREDFSGARSKLQSVFEDEERSDLVRSTAIIALLHLRDADGASWSAVRSYVAEHTESGDAVRAAALAAAAKHWGSGVSDE